MRRMENRFPIYRVIPACNRFLAHCSKKKINLRIKTEHVTVDADATVYVWLLSQIMCKQKRDVYRRIQLQPWQAPFLCGDIFFFALIKDGKHRIVFRFFVWLKNGLKGFIHEGLIFYIPAAKTINLIINFSAKKFSQP